MPAGFRLKPVVTQAAPSIELDREPLIVGRHHLCDVCLDHPSISRRHCFIMPVPNGAIIKDLGSRLGVTLNGCAIENGQIRSGDKVTIGEIDFVAVRSDDVFDMPGEWFGPDSGPRFLF